MTAFQSYFDPMRMGDRVRQDILNDTPCFLSAALIFFPDNIYYKTSPDRSPELCVRMSFHDASFLLRRGVKSAIRLLMFTTIPE
jgi:hypothetical protein